MPFIPVLANGKSYENADVTVTIMGTPIIGVKALSFSETLPDFKGVTGSGRDYVSYVKGKLQKEGSLTLLYEEVANIESALQVKLFDVPLFPITVTFTDPTLITRSYVITAGFRGYSLNSKDGDTATEIELPLFIAAIKKVL
jgi:hypothetical protein